MRSAFSPAETARYATAPGDSVPGGRRWAGRVVVALAGLPLAGLVLTGCSGDYTRCSNNVCHVTIQGVQTVDVFNGVKVSITAITDRTVTMKVDNSRPVEITDGTTAQVGARTIKVRGVEGHTVKFDVS